MQASLEGFRLLTEDEHRQIIAALIWRQFERKIEELRHTGG